MTKRIREGLGVLCVAAVLLVIGVAAGSAGSEFVADIGVGLGGLLALLGLVSLAVELLRNHPGD